MNEIEFLGKLQSQQTTKDVSRLLSQQAGAFGFPTHAIAPMPSEQFPVHDGWFLVQNWPEAWSIAYDEEGFAEFDPIPRAASITSGPISVTDIFEGKAGFTPDPRAARLRELSTSLGRECGLLVPVFGPHGYRAIACYAGPGPDPDAHTQSLLHIWAIYAHDRIRALSMASHAPSLVLSERELDVLRCARDGLGDQEVATQLGISVRTVRFHFTNVRTKLNVVNRTQAVAYASNMGLLP